MSRSHYLFTSVLVALTLLSSSCKQENAEPKDEGLNPQAKSYLDGMAAKEVSNIV